MSAVTTRPRPVTWSVGVTTCSERYDTLLPQTLQSLAAAGWPEPWVFVDGGKAGNTLDQTLQDRITIRQPKLRPYGNWMLGLAEMFIRSPNCERYLMVQDDVISCRDLRTYLDRFRIPANRYLNLYLHGDNLHHLYKTQQLSPDLPADRGAGWYESNQLGRGALALVLPNAAVWTLLSQQAIIRRPTHPRLGWRNIDGAISQSFKNCSQPWLELIHFPSLVQHVGAISTIPGHAGNLQSPYWCGVDYLQRSVTVNQQRQLPGTSPST